MQAALPATVEQCPAATSNLFEHLRRAALDRPALALSCAALLQSEAQREHVLRESFIAAMSADPEAARRFVKPLLGRAWLADAGFFPSLRVAELLAKEDAAVARELLLAAARRHPGVALHEAGTYLALPFGADVLELAIEGAPDEAVGLASGRSQTAEIIRAALGRTTRPALRAVARFVNGGAPVSIRERASVFFRQIASGALTESRAVEIAGSGRYFAEVAALRVQATPADAPMLDRVLERSAQMLFRGMESGPVPPEFRRLSARDLYLLLTYGRTEADAKLFGKLFDTMLAPRLRNGPRPVLALLDSAANLHLRRFLSSAAANKRLESFLQMAGADAVEVLARCFRNLENAARPLDEALAAEAVLDGIERNSRLPALAPILAAEHARMLREGSAEGPGLLGLLSAVLVRRGPAPNPAFRELAERHAVHFKQPRTLDASSLFDTAGVFVQQHFFYDDDDGVESFESFRQTYQGQPHWVWQENGDFVHITGTGRSGRRVEIFANIPDIKKFAAPRDNDSRHNLTRRLTEEGRVPMMYVHRGHSYFVERTVRYLGPSARLVYLGSCRGLENVYSVMSVASRAQIIVSRATGTMEINDPLLKAINEELLAGVNSIDWEQFWIAQNRRLGARAHFNDYLPPHRNGAAVFLAAYWDYLGSL